MTERGRYANGLETREVILDAGLQLITRAGYAAATVQRIADEAGVSKAGLLHHFGSREELLTEILWHRDAPKAEQWYSTSRRTIEPDLVAIFARFLDANVQDRNITEFSLTVTAEASATDHPAHARVRQHYDDIERELLPVVQNLYDDGRLADGLSPRDFLTAAIALMDGLQLRWLYDSSLDVANTMQRALSGLLQAAASSARSLSTSGRRS